jgi:hypothetical protein
VRVGVEGERDAGVSQEILYVLGVYVAGEEQGGAGVPENVEGVEPVRVAIRRGLSGGVQQPAGLFPIEGRISSLWTLGGSVLSQGLRWMYFQRTACLSARWSTACV